MAIIIFQFISSALLIVVAGSFLTKFADKIAEATGGGRMYLVFACRYSTSTIFRTHQTNNNL